MPDCFTCGEDITFDKDIRSKTGKQIPLWPDKQNAHGHDEAGNPIRQPLPQIQQQQRQQSPSTSSYVASNYVDSTKSTQGGPILDTKRILQTLVELSKEVRELKQIIDSRTIIDTNKYEGKSDQIFNVIAPFLSTQGVVAADLLKDKQQQNPEVQGWNSVKAEQQQQQHQQDFPIRQTLKDDEDDEGVSDDL